MDVSPISQRVGFIGAGQMAGALARAFLRSALVKNELMSFSDPRPSEKLKGSGFRILSSNKELVKESDIVFLAVKPAVAREVVEEVAPVFDSRRQLLVSIVAGIPISEYQKLLPLESRIVRVMPNTACLVGQSASAFVTGTHATAEDSSVVKRLMSSCGSCHEVKEMQLDAVTGISGSGPAYVYLMIESLTDAGIRHGLPHALAVSLAAQTVKGAGEMVLETQQHAAVLRQQVCSPGGTTIAGIAAMEREGLRRAVFSGVEAAVKRSVELGKSSS